MNKLLSTFLEFSSIIFLVFMLFGCGSATMTLLDVKATTEKLTVDKAYNSLTSILIDKGFDIKLGNKDLGLVTTEYKQVGGYSPLLSSTNFDKYLQIKAQAKIKPDGKLLLTLTPIVKDVNRLNAAAFTESALTFLSDEEQKHYLTAEKEIQLKAQVLFMNVVQGVADASGLDISQLEFNKSLSK
jgi:hypothetical protein